MTDDKKILIVSVLNQLQERDPAWKLDAMVLKFKTLYEGWAAIGIRHHRHNKSYYSRKWREGWLPMDEYLDFFHYATQ